MKQDIYKLYLGAIVIVALLIVSLCFDAPLWLCVAVTLASILDFVWMLSIVGGLVMFNEKLEKQVEEARGLIGQYKTQISNLQNDIKQKNQTIEDLIKALEKSKKFSEIPFISHIPTIGERIKVVGDFMIEVVPETQTESYRNLFSTFDNDERLVALLKSFDRQVSSSLTTSMEKANGGMDTEEIKECLEKLVTAAIYAVEFGKAAENGSLTNKHLNLKVLAEEITQEEALEEAVTITDYPEETPAWIRGFKKLLLYLDLQDDKTIYVGYKL